MFPIFTLFALLAKNRFLGALIVAWSLLFLALFSSVGILIELAEQFENG